MNISVSDFVEIKSCDRFLFFASRHSIRHEGEMRKEVRQALERQKGFLGSSIFFIPARLDEYELEEPLGEYERVNLFKRDGAKRPINALTGRH